MFSIRQRFEGTRGFVESDPIHFPNMEVSEDEDGVRVFKDLPPVSVSLASDFTPERNAILKNAVSPVYRMQCDAVDLPEQLGGYVQSLEGYSK